MAEIAFWIWIGTMIGALLTSSRDTIAKNIGTCFAAGPVIALLALF